MQMQLKTFKTLGCQSQPVSQQPQNQSIRQNITQHNAVHTYWPCVQFVQIQKQIKALSYYTHPAGHTSPNSTCLLIYAIYMASRRANPSVKSSQPSAKIYAKLRPMYGTSNECLYIQLTTTFKNSTLAPKLCKNLRTHMTHSIANHIYRALHYNTVCTVQTPLKYT